MLGVCTSSSLLSIMASMAVQLRHIQNGCLLWQKQVPSLKCREMPSHPNTGMIGGNRNAQSQKEKSENHEQQVRIIKSQANEKLGETRNRWGLPWKWWERSPRNQEHIESLVHNNKMLRCWLFCKHYQPLLAMDSWWIIHCQPLLFTTIHHLPLLAIINCCQ